MPHATGSSRLAANGLVGPGELPNASARVSARGTGGLLKVERTASATTAETVSLVVSGSEGSRSLSALSHFCFCALPVDQRKMDGRENKG